MAERRGGWREAGVMSRGAKAVLSVLFHTSGSLKKHSRGGDGKRFSKWDVVYSEG